MNPVFIEQNRIELPIFRKVTKCKLKQQTSNICGRRPWSS